jgi:hypothetical protein
MFDEEERYRINVFDWKEEFGQIFKRKNPGFDAVIGNPPYLAGREWKEVLKNQRAYFLSNYSYMTDQYDLYAIFIEKAVKLLSQKGYFSFITPNTWLNSEHYYSLRNGLSNRSEVKLIADFRDVKVFPKATVLPIVIVLRYALKPDDSKHFPIYIFSSQQDYISFFTSISIWKHFPNFAFNISLSALDLPILKKIDKVSKPLIDYAQVRFGVKVYQKGKGNPPQKGPEASAKLFESDKKESDKYQPYIRGKYVSPWHIESNISWLRYGDHLAEPRTIDLFTGPRILVRRIVGRRLILAPTVDLLIADQLLHTVKPHKGHINHHFFAGLLSSKLLSYYFRKRYNRTERTFPEIRIAELRELPIRTIDFSHSEDKARYDRMVSLVQTMLDLNRQLAGAKTGHEKTALKRQIEATDRQIDKLVYKLYDLTDEEIKIIEQQSS